MAVTTILAWIGDAFAPTLLVEAPIVLILLQPAAAQSRPGGTNARRDAVHRRRRVAPPPRGSVLLLVRAPLRRRHDPLDGAKARSGRGDRALARTLLARTSYVAVALVPNQWICLLAGATRMRVWAFVVLNVGGTLARVIAIWMLGDVFSDPLLEVNDWIGDHRLQLTLVTFAIVAIGVWRAMRKGLHPIETPAELAEELRATESGELDERA
jgi:hypothetical protein